MSLYDVLYRFYKADWLTHSGVPGESEEHAARIFGADRRPFLLDSQTR